MRETRELPMLAATRHISARHDAPATTFRSVPGARSPAITTTGTTWPGTIMSFAVGTCSSQIRGALVPRMAARLPPERQHEATLLSGPVCRT